MAFAIPNGSRVNVAKAYLAPIIFTAASNATECELTVASADGIAAGDVIQVNSGWLRLDNMVLRVKSVSGTKVVLEGFNTSDTNKFTAGTGAGTLRKIDSWITMPQVMTLSTEGGDQQTISVQFLEDDKARTIPTFKNAVVQVYSFAHDPLLAIYARLIELDESSDTTAIWFHNPRGKADRFYSAKVSFQKVPKTEINAVESNEARMNFESDMQIYPIADSSASPLAFLSDLPASMDVATGDALDLAVVMQGGSAPYTYVWKKGTTVLSGKTSSAFNIPSVASGDAGSYTCEVTDAAGKTITSGACAVTVS
ncbi:TPA: phage tail protein [Kluyvera ascorbata]|uniref:phage tail tube protein n=1 Tax=Kluyvera ascorbata TaxID=51288 RepID=UPI00290D540B|nr:phage tail tube protein [Kluyvera ascorbata]MDU3913795.1 phage tail tube protein [Kluyvera ascorbata]HDG1683488.1 phage tail protein [Kluyvera ascorbata]